MLHVDEPCVCALWRRSRMALAALLLAALLLAALAARPSLLRHHPRVRWVVRFDIASPLEVAPLRPAAAAAATTISTSQGHRRDKRWRRAVTHETPTAISGVTTMRGHHLIPLEAAVAPARLVHLVVLRLPVPRACP